MKLWSDSFADGGPIPAEFAMGKPASPATFSDNRSPHLAWSGLPAGTGSLVLVCHDPDVPSVGDDVNKEGRTVAADVPRADFFHWVLVDLPPEPAGLAAGECSNGVTKGGKNATGPRGSRRGLNNYTQWFEGNADMVGQYFGYDGPFPPWNDELVHRYHFTLYAIDLARLPVEGDFDGPAVLKALAGHVLDKATVIGTYHIYPDAKANA